MKNNYIRNGGKILFNYAMALIVFLIFIYVFLSITKDSFGKYLPFYSILIFLLLFLIVYSDVKMLAVKEKKPQNNLNPYPLKGLVYGLIGTVPVALIIGVVSVLDFGIYGNLKHIVINSLLGPMFFLIKWLNESIAGYAAGILLLPLIAMLGYLAGYYGINITSKLKKKKVVAEKGFKKSPWNPSNTPVKKTGKKKSGTKKTSGGN
jgi:hypothetical protein